MNKLIFVILSLGTILSTFAYDRSEVITLTKIVNRYYSSITVSTESGNEVSLYCTPLDDFALTYTNSSRISESIYLIEEDCENLHKTLSKIDDKSQVRIEIEARELKSVKVLSI